MMFLLFAFCFFFNPRTLFPFREEVPGSFPFAELYNIKKGCNPKLGYKHTADAIAKMKLRLVDRSNHPMYREKHTLEALQSINKPGE